MNTGAKSDTERVDVTVGIPTRNRSRLLARAISSVLEQSYRHFTLVISDNASDDDTAEVVASFRDPRVVHRPLEENIGMVANMNRLIELADTDFVVLLGDDDELHPDHLSSTVETLKRRPTVGAVHTGCVLVDLAGETIDPHVRVLGTKDALAFETGAQFLERSMWSGWMMCFSSGTFRKAALISGGGLREDDGAMCDLPLLVRIARDWDFAYVNRPLVVMRAHSGSSSSSLGTFTPDGLYRSSRSVPDQLYEHRQTFLAEADLPEREARRLARIAEKAYRRDLLAHLSMRAVTGDGQAVVFKALASELRRDRRLWIDPLTWRFVVGQLGARRLRDRVRRARSATS